MLVPIIEEDSKELISAEEKMVIANHQTIMGIINQCKFIFLFGPDKVTMPLIEKLLKKEIGDTNAIKIISDFKDSYTTLAYLWEEIEDIGKYIPLKDVFFIYAVNNNTAALENQFENQRCCYLCLASDILQSKNS